jgi:hypothetical protein
MSRSILEQCKSDIQVVEEFLSTFGLSMDKVPVGGGWTASQCLAHLADAEISLSLRIRMMLTSDNYNFANWDEDAFAAIKSDRDPKISVEVFKSLRNSNIELISSLREQELYRTGIKPNGETITIIDYVAKMTQHVKTHLEQAVKAAQN